MERYHVIGEFPREAVRVEQVASTQPRIGEIEAATEEAWTRAMQRPGVNLFDGPMCRLESFEGGKTLTLRLSETNYKSFVGTNITHSEFAERYGWGALANALGVSAALETADGFLMMGRRNARVAYYPSRIHPFAGTMEPHPGLNVFDEIARELNEELGLGAGDLMKMTCLGLAEDVSVRQPELIFHVPCVKTRAQIEAQLDAAEHTATVAIGGTKKEVEAMAADAVPTPMGRATLLLWGRGKWGGAWFDEAKRVTSVP